jgi:dethiobiotin synthetase
MASGYYVTGTDTAAGKTLASVALLHALRARGLRAVGMKPVASGCSWPEGWRNEDALALQAASEPRRTTRWSIPSRCRGDRAADRRRAGRHRAWHRADARRLRRARRDGDAVVVEGVGGWLAPSPTASSRRSWRAPAAAGDPGGRHEARLPEPRAPERAPHPRRRPAAGRLDRQPVDPRLDYGSEYAALVRARWPRPAWACCRTPTRARRPVSPRICVCPKAEPLLS